jgi:hypothetical protein
MSDAAKSVGRLRIQDRRLQARYLIETGLTEPSIDEILIFHRVTLASVWRATSNVSLSRAHEIQ